MKLFTASQIDQINRIAEKSKESLQPIKSVNVKSINSDLNEMSQKVIDYFKDSEAILITDQTSLHEYVTNCIKCGYAGIDTETTGLDRVHDTIVGASLYYPGGVECYIPSKHLVPIFDTPYKDQLTYEQIQAEFQRFADSNIKLIFANADFDLAMIYKDIKVDLSDVCYYDVILAWRCMKENELHNDLKSLYNKYCLKGKGDPMKFKDFFSPKLFPYCKPEIAKLYAANDAKITFDLFQFQLPYITKSHPKCKKAHLEAISDLVWNVELPLIKVCQNMHRTGVYLDKNVSEALIKRYGDKYDDAMEELSSMVQEIIEKSDYSTAYNRPFRTGKDFNPSSPKHVQYLLYTMMKINVGKDNAGTGKEILTDLNLPVTNQILKVRSLSVLINTFVKKLPNSTTSDSRIHAEFRQIGADCVTGDTIIPTKQGYFLAKELCEASEASPGNHIDVSDVDIVNMNQTYEKAQSVITYKNYPTIKITTEFGFIIEGTYNHPIMVSKYTSSDVDVLHNPNKLQNLWKDRYFKQLSDIKVGDIVEIPCNYLTVGSYQPTNFVLGPCYKGINSQATIPEYYDEPFAEFLGMYHADGSASFREGTYTIALSNDDNDVINRFDYLSEKLFNIKTCRYEKHSDKNEVESYINCMRICEMDKILSHGKQYKRIPKAIWKSPPSVINAYIRGMTLDSSVYYENSTNRVQFELSIINELDARLVQLHLASQGILCGWGWNQNKSFKSPRLKFNADNYILFRDRIGFVETKKIVNTDCCRKSCYKYRRIGNSFRVKVKHIEISNKDVYDLHVPYTHSFVANGIISHNTGRLSSAEPNMQNIPAHATDIRHMFRATAASKQSVECSYDESLDNISVSLSRWDKVYTDCGEKNVNDLVEGDLVKLEHDGKVVYRNVKHVEDSNSDACICNVIF